MISVLAGFQDSGGHAATGNDCNCRKATPMLVDFCI